MAYRTHNHGVAASWVAGKRDEAQSGNGNMSHTGATLWSYNTPIGNIVTLDNGERVALLTTETYSVTTEGKHKGAAWRALHRSGMRYYRVPFLLLNGGYAGRSMANAIARRNGSSAADEHAANVADYDARIKAETERVARARVYKSTDALDRLTAERDTYKATFGL